MNPRLSPSVILLRYAAFAVAATLANLATQRLVLAGGTEAARFAAAVAAGTLVGLVVKYALDKRWIFRDHAGGLRGHGRRFPLYAATGVATTSIFWGTETAFWLAFGTETMREAGAILGLAVGYAAKYRLDRRFVFAAPSAGARLAA